jgi:hypothetical protein
MSPFFCYRVDLLCDTDNSRALTDLELASRLSYFLWSSVPDDELLQCAAQGELHKPDVLLQQTRRLMQDDRVRGLATEFAGNWLDFRRFEEHNSVDREQFPSFDNALRSAMFEEPIRFFVDAVQHNRSALDFLFADRMFVNGTLAKHYNINNLHLEDSQWQAIDNASEYARGGLLTMAVFMTKNAPGLRTSPVKRGYWVARNLLGERIPPPPPDVPELPNDESKMGELTLGEMLAKHREHKSCSGCHDRIDPLGIVFEGFGPIGELRDVDLGNRPVQTQAVFPDGKQRTGISDLKLYLKENQTANFVDNMHRKLLSYALSRTLLLSDDGLLRQVRQAGENNDHRLGTMIETIVSSPQFLNKRGRQQPGLVNEGKFDGQ